MSVVEKPGYVETGTGWIPDGWVATTLGEVADFRGGNAFKEKYQGKVAGDFPFIKVSDFNLPLNQIFIQQANHWIDAVTNKEIKATLFDEGTVVFAKVGAALLLNRRRILTRKTAIDNNLMAAIPRHIDPKFFYYHLQTVDFGKLVQDGAVPSVNQGQLQSLPISHPPFLEQQKIAAILTAVDDKLDIVARQIEATQTLKQGLMQTLFSKGVGTQDADGRWAPHTEFKESELGAIPVAWRVLSLNDVVETLDKQRVPLKQADRAQRSGKYPYYGASGIIDWIDGFIFDGDFILLGEDGENVVSRNLPLAFRAKGRIWVNNHAHVFQPKAGFDIEFLVELLESLDYSHLVSGTAQPKITQQALKQLRFAIPPFSEQQKIGSVLSGIERKQAILRGKLSSYQNLKRGLMQKLLTGEWRVTLDMPQDLAIAA
jgi:type I restriction enzyme S subunit